MMNRWQRLFEGIKTEIKVFIFFSALLTAFRIVFLAVFQSQLASVTMENILTSLWLGFRLSLKTYRWSRCVECSPLLFPR